MSVESQENVARFIGNGTTTSFPLNFPVVSTSHIWVIFDDGVTREKIESGFDVVGAGTGSVRVVFAAAPTDGVLVIIMRILPLLQLMKLQNMGDFNATTLNNSADSIVMMIIQLAEEVRRAVKFPPGEVDPDTDIEDWLNQLRKYAEDARLSAERAAAASDPAALASSIYNIRRAWVLEADVAAGETLRLPGVYFPTRNVLSLHYQGVLCAMRGPLIEPSQLFQYSEVGEDMNATSNEVVLHFNAKTGDVFDMHVTHSGLGGAVDQVETAVVDAQAAAVRAESAAERAENAAGQVTGGAAKTRAMISELLPAGTAVTVPAYSVGSGLLNVFWDGVFCWGGSDPDKDTYQEVGAAGSPSTSIIFFDDIPAGAEIAAVVFTIREDEA